MPYLNGDRANVEIVSHGLVQSMSGNWGIEVTMSSSEKGEITSTVYLTDASVKFLDQFLAAVGLDPATTDPFRLDPSAEKPIDICGKKVSVAVVEREKNGKVQRNVYINPPIVASDSPEAKAQFSAIGKSLKAARAANAAAAKAKAVEPKDGAAEEDKDPRF
jgi:hypothetical protein